MIIITGASKGIGKFLYESYKSQGFDVIGTYHSSKVEGLYKLDISNKLEVEQFVESIKDKLSKVVLISCSGTSYSSFAHKSDIDLWESVVDVNLKGTFNIIRNLLPYMRQDGFGRIINFSSVVAQMGVHGTSAYAASKSALWGMTKAIAIENATKNITINNINLGYFEIGMGLDMPADYKKIIMEKIPTKSFGNPEDIIKTINYIKDTSYLNGANIDLNGAII
ncbi:SDR family oxidoreductase [Olleya aquimaris]|nr:SDR family oxidoreductase [Olleya aquimaris]